MSSTYGEHLKLSIFGQSHGPAIGMVLDGVPAGLPVDREALGRFLARRAPGKNGYSTPRREADLPEFLGGLRQGRTCGAPIAAVIYNQNAHSQDYVNLQDCPRPGHADFTAQIKYGGFQDAAGGGHFSGRLTAPLCVAGGMCKQWLEAMGIFIQAHLLSVGTVRDAAFDPRLPALSAVDPEFPVLDPAAGEQMRQAIQEARSRGDSLGGVVECAAVGLPAGWGEPMFGGMESRIAALIFAIPGVKGLDFGSGFAGSETTGSQNNDAFVLEDGRVATATNHAGGILGGITNGMPLQFRVAVKPTPSISLPQQTVRLSTGQPETLTVTGRHDPCIAPRAVPVVEAAAAIALFDAYLSDTRRIPYGLDRTSARD